MTRTKVFRWCARFAMGWFLLGAMNAGSSVEVCAGALRAPFSFDKYTNGELGPRPIMTRRDWWVVWADRADVPVYKDRQGNQRDPSRVLSFREQLVVLDEEEASEMLLLGKTDTPPSDPREPVITGIVGWVKWDHLILSYAPIKDRDTLISRKAFVINDWRRYEGKKSIEEFKRSLVDVRAAPSEDAPVLETITGMGQRFSYVYKYDSWDNPEPEWYLVGKQRTIYYWRAEDNIVGWIPARRAQPWDTRQALEPDPDRQSPAHIYALQEEVSDPHAQPLFVDTMKRDPWPPDKWRYAVLLHERGREGIQIGWFGTLQLPRLERPGTDTTFAGNEAEAREAKTVADFTARAEFFERGWVRMTDDQGRRLMRPVQLVSRADLAETERALNRLFISGRTPDRVNLKEAWEEVTAVIVGEKPRNAREYFYMVGGILFREESPILSLDYDEILDMPDDEFEELLAYISDARERISALKAREGIWFFNYDDEYAWIPIEDMP